MQKVAVLDVGFGNIRSIFNALELAGAEPFSTYDPLQVSTASHLVVPGVGSYRQAMRKLEHNKLRDSLSLRTTGNNLPTLGICLGAQLFLESSDEGGSVTEGLALIEGRVARIKKTSSAVRVPHTGWNAVEATRAGLSLGLGPRHSVFFNHEYQCQLSVESEVMSVALHGTEVTAMFKKDNLIGLQFHPEKSGRNGLRYLRYFLELQP